MHNIKFEHRIRFQQTRDGKEKTSLIVLREPFRMFALNGAEGSWAHGEVYNDTGENVHLYRNAPPGERKFLLWSWNSDTFEIVIGKSFPRASHKAGEEMGFQKWITLFRAKRSADWKFSVGSPYSDGTGSAQYELHGSSDSYDPLKPAYWYIVPYNR